ncbi:hypothetical protein KY285_012345 [Solanum tuberosum]|nr:hypothetical protein KY289_011775 [Solanum tuberosum]KAH0736638.1 hypothetical protein KY285_012345 [Solanum tuberosum]
MEIEILCTKLIKPFLPTPPHLQHYNLSFFDQISEKEHVPIVLFYANNNFINNSTIDERIEQSISKILTHVYPAAGRYDKDECSILCLDQGVSYTKAKPSRVEIITALLWRAFIGASAIINGETKMKLHHFIILIRDTVNKVVASCNKASPDEVVSTLVNIYNESDSSPEWGGNDEVDKVLCSSLCNFPFHDTDFGLGKPALLFFGMKDIQMFWLYDTDIHSEVGVQLDLKESYMQLFECDDDIKALMFIRNANL